KVSAAGLAERDRRVFASMRERGVPVVVTMAGGYGHDIHQTVAIQLETLRMAQAVAVHPRSPAHPHVETAT
ncbi:hypothetical protein OFM21_30265, partial [Escherichia coli]|nr:hypothetical protein [Escherichia coli]